LERTSGPQGIFEEDDEEARLEKMAKGEVYVETGEEFDQDKLRRYQKLKMTYHVGIVKCDSVGTAVHLYKQCDGMEFERSSNVLDLRYVHDTFFAKLTKAPRETARDVPADYEPPEFATSALQQTKVDLAWDKDDPRRSRLTQRDFSKGEILEDDYKTYLASGSDEDEDDEEGASKYMKLLGGEEEDDDMEGIEISWNVGLENSAKDLVKKVEKKKEQKDENVYEKYLRERQEKKKARKYEERTAKKAASAAEDEKTVEEEEEGPSKAFNDPFFSQGPQKTKSSKQRERAQKKKEEEQQKDDEDKKKAELELLVMGSEEAEGFDLKDLEAAASGKVRKKGLSKRNKKRLKNNGDAEAAPVDTFQVDTEDDRFKTALSSKDFHIDPTANAFKNTEGMKKIRESVSKFSSSKQAANIGKEKSKKSKQEDQPERSTQSLIDSVKRGAAEHQVKKKKKKTF